MNNKDNQYRPSIDGMRGIAVLGVFVYHLNPSWLPGGFVGVDIFFVISGYVITLMILRDIVERRFYLITFFQRRIARIFPHSFVVTLVCLSYSCFVFSPEELGAIGTASMAVVLGVANVKFAFQGDYFDFWPDIQPLLHCWSLGVEEQFYLLWPILLVGLHNRQFTSVKCLFILFALLLSSLLMCIVLTTVNNELAFYLIPTRAWELLSGCILAIISVKRTNKINPLNSLFQIVGLLIIIFSFYFIREKDFPGIQAFAPVLGAILLVGIDRQQIGSLEKLLSKKEFVWVGRLSYSIYLWHWPVFCLLDYQFLTIGPNERTLFKILVSLGFAIGGFYFIEKPLRNYLGQRGHQLRVFGLFFTGVVILLVFGFVVGLQNYSNVNILISDVANGGRCIYQEKPSGKMVLIGDSNAGMYGKSFVEIANQLNFQGHILSVHSTDPMPGSKLWEEYIKFLEHARPDIVIFVASWGSKLTTQHRLDFQHNLEKIHRYARQVVIITKPPNLPLSSPRAEIRKTGSITFLEKEIEKEKRRSANRYLITLESDWVTVLKTDDYFLNPDGSIRFLDNQGQQLFYDRTHLSYYGASLLKSDLVKIIQDLQ